MPNKWADHLPPEIWEIIKTHINSRIDVYRFRAVCRSWRALLPLSHLQTSLSPLYLPPSPLSNYLPPSPSSNSPSATSFLCPLTICRLEPANHHNNNIPNNYHRHHPLPCTCLIKVEETPQGQMQLLTPLSNHQLKTDQNNHHQNDDDHHPRTLNLLHFRLVELGRYYTLKSSTGSPVIGIAKMLVLEKNSITNNTNLINFGFEILCVFRDGKLGHWKYGDQEWILLDQQNIQPNYHDIILHKGQVYVVDKSGIVWWINSNCLTLVQYSPPLYLGGDRKNLVESEGHLYVVDRYFGDERKRVSEMRAYRLDEEWGTWVHVFSLGDRVVVLGNDCCFSAPALELVDCSHTFKNCIFFTDSCDEEETTRGISGYRTRVFNLDDRRIRRVLSFCGHIWMFTPPVQWLDSNQ